MNAWGSGLGKAMLDHLSGPAAMGDGVPGAWEVIDWPKVRLHSGWPAIDLEGPGGWYRFFKHLHGPDTALLLYQTGLHCTKVFEPL